MKQIISMTDDSVVERDTLTGKFNVRATTLKEYEDLMHPSKSLMTDEQSERFWELLEKESEGSDQMRFIDSEKFSFMLRNFIGA